MNLFSTSFDSAAETGALHPPPSTLHLPPIARSILLLVALLTAFHSPAALACNVPVFRYALEKWRPDPYELVVFHQGALTEEERAAVGRIQAESIAQEGLANLAVTLVDVDEIEHAAILKIWERVKGDARERLPYLVLQTPVASGQSAQLWQGKLADFDPQPWLASPSRTELIQRLLAGQSVVWMLIPGSDEEATDKLRDSLTTWLKRLESEIEVPAGIGEPGSEIESPLPVAIRFSILEIRPDDPNEAAFLKQLLQATPDLVESRDPLLIPIFGTGRALDVLTGEELDEQTIERAARYLCGACSCQVKEQNPGFDLLLQADWDSIFAAGAPRIARQTKRGEAAEAEYVPIPSGPVVMPAPTTQPVAAVTRVIVYPTWIFIAGGVLGLFLLALLVAVLAASASSSGRRERE